MWCSGSDQQLHQGSHRVHPVEDPQGLAQVDQHEPGGESKELLPQTVLKLGVGPEGRDDPQLSMRIDQRGNMCC